MKKVLSVAMASAMVLGMGANAFAIQYSTGSNDKADWPTNFQFDGELFVTDKDGSLIKESTTAINDSEAVDFQPGDVIWMPLYADDQKVYDAEFNEAGDDVDEVASVRVEAEKFAAATWKDNSYKVYKDNGKYYDGGHNEVKVPSDIYLVEDGTLNNAAGEARTAYKGYTVKVDEITKVTYGGVADREVKANSTKYYVGTSKVSLNEFKQAVAEGKEAYATVVLKEIEGADESIGKPTTNEVVEYGHYTGNIDKNWSINLIEKDGTVKDLIAKAELYKATATDYASYSRYNNNVVDIQPNAVYLKVTLKDSWKTVSSETLKYYVYIANNNNTKKTNQVWVSGKYAPDYRKVDFTWTNNANTAGLWKAEDNGVAVFDFADKAFFTVKMYKGETMYLDLSTAYDKAIAGEMDADADSFYKFDNTNANFSRAGELVIVTDDETLVPYEIDEDGNFVELDAEYVKDYAVAHTNAKVNGFKFNTKQLGNYVLSTEELGAEEEVEEEEPEVDEEEAPEVDEPEVNEVPETNKPNPETGAEDFVGLAVSLAVVSVAAAGALALKK